MTICLSLPESRSQGDVQAGWICFEDLIEAQAGKVEGYRWPKLEENTACGLCYTSGTTGRPKVPFSVRLLIVLDHGE